MIPRELMYWEGPPPREALTASTGKFRVVTVDTFSNEGGIEDEFDTQDEAVAVASKLTVRAVMYCAYVYDDKGELVFSAGDF